jgi:hypothetical protein
LFVLLLLFQHDHKALPSLPTGGQVGKGDFDVDFICVESRDEVGVLADAFNKMIDSLKEHGSQIKTRNGEESASRNAASLEAPEGKPEIFLQSQIYPISYIKRSYAGTARHDEGAEKTTVY